MDIHREMTDVMQRASFNMRKWRTSSRTLQQKWREGENLDSISSENSCGKVLEYIWESNRDIMKLPLPDIHLNPDQVITKSLMLGITLGNNHFVARMVLANSHVLSRSEFEKPIRICLSPSNFMQHELAPKPPSTPFFYLNQCRSQDIFFVAFEILTDNGVFMVIEPEYNLEKSLRHTVFQQHYS
ncbi:hypothetical protein AVEN_75491-1 [Araneus ventricosus]|uniref:Uncharacterized protein n=1 Tax=Araneus ventricosus TaxID=182803 RepID=A0A4Y2DQJ1_ARAVE|nr:hypothetical protein AVEN_75491-1 [Araneus ventricosus]